MPFAPQPAGHQIHYRVVGTEGPPVVLLMGIGVSGRLWGPVPDMLARDPDGPFRVLVVDNRGTGESDMPRGGCGIADMADDVVGVLNHAGLAQAVVIGISMGGMIALKLTLRHPERVAGLGLLCTTPGFPLGVPPGPATVARLISGFSGGMRGKTLLHLMYPEAQIGRALERLRSPEYARYYRGEPFDMGTLLRHLTATSLHRTAPWALARIGCPAVVVTGEDDQLIPPRNSRTLARRIPGAELRTLPDVGHDIMTLCPEAVCDTARRLSARITPPHPG